MVGQWFRAKVEFRREEAGSVGDLSRYAAKFQKGVINSLRGRLPEGSQYTITYYGRPSKGCFEEQAWVYISGFAGAAAMVAALGGGELRSAVSDAIKAISGDNVARAEIQTANPREIDPGSSLGGDPPSDDSIQIFVEEAPPTPNRKPTDWRAIGGAVVRALPWLILFAVLAIGQIRSENRDNQHAAQVDERLQGMEEKLALPSASSEQIDCPPPPDISLSCPAPSESRQPAERRVRRYSTN